MKITDIKAFPIKMPFVKRDVPMSTRPFRVITIVKVMTDEGITGIGEAFGWDATTANIIEGMLKPAIVGKDPMQMGRIYEETYKTFYNSARLGLTICALSGIEIALWDIAGKALKAPVYQLLGGLAHDKIRAYGSLPHYANPGEVKAATEVMLKKGYTAIKLHAVDVPSVAIAREVAGENVDIMLDVNCKWNAVDAVRVGRQLEPYNLFWFEEPVWPVDDYDGLAEVKASLAIPIAAGENEYTARGFNNLIEKRAADYLQPSVFKIGGIGQQKKVFTLGATLARRVVPHSWTFGPALAATLHVCFSEPISEFVETVIEHPETSIYTKPIIMPENGYWRPPEGPGLGFELDDKVIAKYGI